LISLPRTDGKQRPYYIMIDCGVILGTADPGPKMTDVVESIVAETQGEIDLLLATHEHWDHVSGFVQAKSPFGKLKGREGWLGWPEGNADPLTKKLKVEQGLALASLRMGLSQLQLGGDAGPSAEVGGILDFFGAAQGASASDALENVRKMA